MAPSVSKALANATNNTDIMCPDKSQVIAFPSSASIAPKTLSNEELIAQNPDIVDIAARIWGVGNNPIATIQLIKQTLLQRKNLAEEAARNNTAEPKLVTVWDGSMKPMQQQQQMGAIIHMSIGQRDELVTRQLSVQQQMLEANIK